MSVSSISGGASPLSRLASAKPAKPVKAPPKPQTKTDADGDYDGTTAPEAGDEKAGKVDVKG
jgi:hypothetical protein